MSHFILTPSKAPWSLRGLVSSGMIDEAGAELLGSAVRSGRCIVVAGPQGSGRSSVLGALAQALSKEFCFASPSLPAVPGFSARAGSPDGVPLVVDDLEVDPDDLRRVRMVSALGRGPGGALAGLGEHFGGDLDAVARHFDLVVTCARRSVQVHGEDVKRRVVARIDEVGRLGANKEFELTTRYQAHQEAGAVSWSDPFEATRAQARELVKANIDCLPELVDSLLVLERNDTWTRGLGENLSALSQYSGPTSVLAGALRDVCAGDSSKEPFSELNAMANFPMLLQVELNTYKLLGQTGNRRAESIEALTRISGHLKYWSSVDPDTGDTAWLWIKAS